jgi:UV DNA damage repair endonuclease
VYGDKEVTLARFKENYRTLLSDDIKARLVIENDEVSLRSLRRRNPCSLCSVEMCYNVDDLLPISEELDLPIVVSPLILDENYSQNHTSSTIIMIGFMQVLSRYTY